MISTSHESNPYLSALESFMLRLGESIAEESNRPVIKHCYNAWWVREDGLISSHISGTFRGEVVALCLLKEINVCAFRVMESYQSARTFCCRTWPQDNGLVYNKNVDGLVESGRKRSAWIAHVHATPVSLLGSHGEDLYRLAEEANRALKR